MVSAELIRRYPFFAGLNLEQITILTRMAREEEVEAGHFFLHEQEKSSYLYLVVEGTVSVVITVPRHKEIVVGTVGPGEVFGWSALVPPHTATATVKATTPCKVIAIDCQQLLAAFEDDPQFGYLMMTKIAQVTRDRVTTLTTETLVYLIEETGE